MDREKVIKGLECCKRKDGNECKVCPYTESEYCTQDMATDALAMLKEQQSTLGVVQTANAITFTATGDAKQGEERGLMLGKAYMREHIEKELFYKNLLTDEIKEIIRGID